LKPDSPEKLKPGTADPAVSTVVVYVNELMSLTATVTFDAFKPQGPYTVPLDDDPMYPLANVKFNPSMIEVIVYVPSKPPLPVHVPPDPS
jgi:hypothetical protein